jgi:glucosamine--fructose-6-phosphate aminotransferase (isomerizing)
MPEELIPIEIHDIPSAIRATVAETHPAAAKEAKAMRNRSPGMIYLIGNGTSLYSSMAATYTARALSTTASPQVIAMPAGDFRYFTPQLSQDDVVVGVSASGEFRDVLAVFKQLGDKCLCIGITHVADSTITHLTNHLLISSGGPSNVPVMTKTYVSTLTALHLLLLEFFDAPRERYDDLLQSADFSEAAIGETENRVGHLVKELKSFENGFYFGAGPAYAAAMEAALKMKEMAIVHSEGSETWEMASGPAIVVGPKTFCVALYTGQATDEETAGGARHACDWGARVLEAGPRQAADDLYLPVASSRFEPFSTLALVPPLALLAYRNARARGYYPDRPAWRERYLSQGMTHILGE